MLDLFDSHVHLDSKEYDADREDVITRARAAGVTAFVSIGAGYGVESAKRAVAIAESHPFVWASAGIHPHDAAATLPVEELRELAQHPRVVAIGETGLDFHYDIAPRDAQERWFRAQIELAIELQKPLIIHSRKAAPECFALLSSMHAGDVGGVFHCYSEDAEFARKLRDINFMVSIPGVITFKNAEATRQAVREIPVEQIMLETDGPFLAPIPYRGKRCESSFMVETAKAVAALKDMTVEELAQTTTKNAKRFFKLSAEVA
ncbi:MAG: TatD family hydrolase [Deltaproteobacteria bacterium]|nr:TatD family hydrolase [Deltaproteobacteria bacterium]